VGSNPAGRDILAGFTPKLIAFATPLPPGIAVTNGSTFLLNEKQDDKWFKWSPPLDITNADAAAAQDSPSSLLLNNVNSGSKQ
jgi:hypothetical protein